MATKPKPNPILNPPRPKANPALAVSSTTKIGKVTGAGEAKMAQRRAIEKYPFSNAEGVGSPREKLAASGAGAKGQLAAEKLAKTARQTRKGK